MKPYKRYTFKLFNIGKPVARAIMKAHKKRGISRSAWLLEAVSYKLVREGITVNTENYGPVWQYNDIRLEDYPTNAEYCLAIFEDRGFMHGCLASLTGDVKFEVMSNPDIVKSTLSDGSSVLLDYKTHTLKINKKAELKEVSN